MKVNFLLELQQLAVVLVEKGSLTKVSRTSRFLHHSMGKRSLRSASDHLILQISLLSLSLKLFCAYIEALLNAVLACLKLNLKKEASCRSLTWLFSLGAILSRKSIFLLLSRQFLSLHRGTFLLKLLLNVFLTPAFMIFLLWLIFLVTLQKFTFPIIIHRLNLLEKK